MLHEIIVKGRLFRPRNTQQDTLQSITVVNIEPIEPDNVSRKCRNHVYLLSVNGTKLLISVCRFVFKPLLENMLLT